MGLLTGVLGLPAEEVYDLLADARKDLSNTLLYHAGTTSLGRASHTLFMQNIFTMDGVAFLPTFVFWHLPLNPRCVTSA